MQSGLKDKISKLKQDKNISEIYLFGSVARGDEDRYSDVDILIVIDDCLDDEYVKLKDKYANYLNVPVSWISMYRISKIMTMYKMGSYFLWHIKKEGKILYSRNNELQSLLLTLPQYNGFKNDLQEYSQILYDIELELENEYLSADYELAVLASLVRNTCITIAYLNNRLDFGRNSAPMYCFDKYKMNISLKEYEALYQYRLYHTGKIKKVVKAETKQLKKWIKIEKTLLEIAKKGVNNND